MYEIEIQDNSRANVYTIETNVSPIQAINGKTGNVTIGKTDIGLTNVDNTADIDKPISRAVLSALEELERKILAISQSFENDNDVDFDVPLPAGIDQIRISYPQALNKMPSSIYCYIKNNNDDVIYENSVSEITLTDFLIEFSDFLSSSSYILNVRVSF
jgi:hypothetical protein